MEGSFTWPDAFAVVGMCWAFVGFVAVLRWTSLKALKMSLDAADRGISFEFNDTQSQADKDRSRVAES